MSGVDIPPFAAPDLERRRALEARFNLSRAGLREIFGNRGDSLRLKVGIEDLHRRLLAYLAFEEDIGEEALETAFPHLGRRIRALADERRELRRDSARLRLEARSAGSMSPAAVERFAARLEDLRRAFQRHERCEAELRFDAFETDIGPGD